MPRSFLASVTYAELAPAASTRARGTPLFGVATVDPIVFVGVPVVLLAVEMVASWLPAQGAG